MQNNNERCMWNVQGKIVCTKDPNPTSYPKNSGSKIVEKFDEYDEQPTQQNKLEKINPFKNVNLVSKRL